MGIFNTNPFLYIFQIILIVGVGGYYVYGAIDRLGLNVESTEAVVTGKQLFPGSTTYIDNTVAGQPVLQRRKNPDIFVLFLKVNGESTTGSVSQEMYDMIPADTHVQVKFKRTRLSHRHLVIEVTR